MQHDHANIGQLSSSVTKGIVHLRAEPTCEPYNEIKNYLTSKVCTPQVGIISDSGCPFIEDPNLTLGVCSNGISSAERLLDFTFVSTVQCWATKDGKAVGYLAVHFTGFENLAPSGLGNADLARGGARPQAILDISKTFISEIRMWYSKTLDANYKAQVGWLYIKTSSNQAAFECGDRTGFNFSQPDSLISHPRGRGLGPMLAGITAMTSIPAGSRDPASITALNFWIVKKPTSAALTTGEVPSLSIKPARLEEKKTLAVPNLSPRTIQVQCQSMSWTSETRTEWSNAQTVVSATSKVEEFSIGAELSVGWDVWVLEMEVSISTSYTATWSYSKEVSDTYTILQGTSSSSTVTIPE